MISIIIPFYNEEKNISLLTKELRKVLSNLKEEYEVLLVDDGSEDKGAKEADQAAKGNPKFKVFHLRKRMGKGHALASGVEKSHGDVVLFMDADLQDDPADITRFLKKLNEGYDLINGIRDNRKDTSLIKTYSKLANLFLRKALRSPFSDINCPFKAMRRAVLDEVVLYANNFRFFPMAVYYKGFKVAEIPVNNRPRRFGKSKFGAGKLFVGLLDTLNAFFLYKFSESPLHFFGPMGLLSFAAGFLILLYLTIERLFFGELLYRRPVLFLGMLLLIVGIQVIATGILGELIVYLNKKNKT